MDTGEIAIIASIWGGVLAILITLFILMRQSNNELRVEFREFRRDMRDELRDVRDEIAKSNRRVSDAELQQARLDAVNDFLSRQTHTHEVSGD